jgi:hypothetical protein
MAWYDRSITLTVEDWGPYIDKNNDYSDYKQVLTLTASTNSSTGKLHWTLTASNNYSGGVATTIYLKIGTETIYNRYWSYENRGNRAWNSYPTGDGSASGSFDIGSASDSTASFPISLKLCCAQNATGTTSRYKTTSGTLTRTWYANIGGGTVGVTDHFNNSYTVTGTGPANATSNDVTSTVFCWTEADGTTGSETKSNTSTAEFTKTIAFTPDNTNNTRLVSCSIDANSTYNNPAAVSSGDISIRQYAAPNAPGIPRLTEDSKKNNRLTLKQQWQYLWTPATPGTGIGTMNGTNTDQTTSRVTGYRVLLYKKSALANTYSTIPIKVNSNGTYTSISSFAEGVYYYDTGNNYINIDPVACGLVPGDSVKLGIRPYTQYGFNNSGDKLIRSTITESVVDTVQNAGIVRVKVGNTGNDTNDYKEGQVWVKISNTGNDTNDWKEADIVKVKVSDTGNTTTDWQESE